MDEESHDSIDMESNDTRRNTVVPWRSGKYFIFLCGFEKFFFFELFKEISNGVNVKKLLNIRLSTMNASEIIFYFGSCRNAKVSMSNYITSMLI